MQGVFFNAYFLAYIISPKSCHAFVGYLEEEAVKTYTHAIHDLDTGRLPEWATKEVSCAVLCCAVLCCAVLCCAVSRCAALCRAVLCRAVPCMLCYGMSLVVQSCSLLCHDCNPTVDQASS